MRGLLVLGTMALLLAGCSQPAPQGQGVGFGEYSSYQRDAALTGAPASGFSGAGPVTTSPYGMAVPASAAPVPAGGIPSSALSAAGIGVAPVASGPIGAPLPGVSAMAPAPGGFTSAAPLPGVSSPASGGLVSVASSNVAGDVNVMRSTGLEASPSNAAPTLVGAMPLANPSVPGSNGGISDEQSFEAVSSRESIESDAARRAQQAAQYQVVQPQALPEHPADTGPNIVEYALAAPNSVGQAWYSRFMFSGEGRQQRNCGKYRTADEAQRDFLARGGPNRDALGLDSDGDGFACAWDPAPFRAAVGRG